MICPRCDSNKVDLLTKSPVGDEWEVYICKTCCFSWRSTESEDIKDPNRYDKRFKIDKEQINSLDKIPPIPALIEESK